ncbi:MAG: DUF1848 family protein [Planctomycetes bacterium]|nr:DUF1848 family protein [Planctomycetota bacterium]
MIYSASRRTDLPRFFADFIVGKVARSRKLEAIVFWTKDPRNFINHEGLAKVIDDYPAIIQLTITGLGGSEWEPDVPHFEDFFESLRLLGKRLPRGAIMWRFDPVIVDNYIYKRYRAVQELLTSALGEVNEVTISFPDPYRKVTKRLRESGLAFPELDKIKEREVTENLLELGCGISGNDNFTIHSCCEPHLLDIPGVVQAKCVDGERFDRLYGTSFGKMDKDGGQRPTCGCVKSTDIGSYEQACMHRCRYCYARPEE